MVLVVKNSLANAGDVRDTGSIPGSGRSPGVGNGNPLEYSCMEEPRVSCLNPGKPSRDLLQHVSRPDSPTMAREQ